MTIDELKTRIESYREDLRSKSGSRCLSSEAGPVGMELVEAIVTVLEDQQKRINQLENKTAKGPRP